MFGVNLVEFLLEGRPQTLKFQLFLFSVVGVEPAEEIPVVSDFVLILLDKG